MSERGDIEVFTPNGSGSIRTAQQMQQMMGNQQPNVNFVDQSTRVGETQMDQQWSEGQLTVLIRDVVSSDTSNSNTRIGRAADRRDRGQRRLR